MSKWHIFYENVHDESSAFRQNLPIFESDPAFTKVSNIPRSDLTTEGSDNFSTITFITVPEYIPGISY